MIDEPIYLINSAFGTYIPQTFAERYKNKEFSFEFIDKERADKLIDELLNDPTENEFYYEAYEELLSLDVILNGQELFLYHDEDLWLCPVGYDFEEQ